MRRRRLGTAAPAARISGGVPAVGAVSLSPERLNPRPDTVCRHLRPDRGRGVRPWRFQTKRRRASRKRPADCSHRVLAIGGIIFGPRSIFDPVMAGQMSFFRKFYDFSTLRVQISKTIDRSDMKPSPACSPFNSFQFSVEYFRAYCVQCS